MGGRGVEGAHLCSKKHYKVDTTLMEATGYSLVVPAGLITTGRIPGVEPPGYSRMSRRDELHDRRPQSAHRGSRPGMVDVSKCQRISPNITTFAQNTHDVFR
jgi:hypothetical protein